MGSGLCVFKMGENGTKVASGLSWYDFVCLFVRLWGSEAS